MDLGAPILDVQASVVKASDTSSATSTPKTTSIISGGVVSAPGYEPLVISTGGTTTEVQGGIFVPNIPIMQVNTTVITEKDKYVDRVDYIN